MVKEFLLGDNPFTGVSHLAQERAREETRESTLKNMVEVLESAYAGGATGFTFSTHSTILELLQHLETIKPGLLNQLDYYILVPYIRSYVRKSNTLGMTGLVKTVLASLMSRQLPGFLTALLTLDFNKLATIFIYNELKPYLKTIPRKRIKAVLLHEVLTELIIAYNLTELYTRLEQHVHKQLGIGFGLETRNISHLEQWLKNNDLTPDYIMTPINPLGYQMTPTKEEAEESIRNLSNKSRIIGINILASGAITLEQAVSYLSNWKDNIHAVAVGTSKPWRAKENFQLLKTSLST